MDGLADLLKFKLVLHSYHMTRVGSLPLLALLSMLNSESAFLDFINKAGAEQEMLSHCCENDDVDITVCRMKDEPNG